MGGVQVEADPGDLGMDAARLRRADGMLNRFVTAGLLPGYQLLISRRGRVVHLTSAGCRHVEDGLPVAADTIWRIYSMTKPVTSVAIMMLYEEGAFELTDPVSRYLPAFADPRVYVAGSDLKPLTEPAVEPIRIWHLLTHTSGLTYGFHRVHPVDGILRAHGYDINPPDGVSLADAVDLWASLPLLFHPGREWNYSLSSDVLGRLVEVVAGMRFEDFLAERIFGPLAMPDTAFHVPPDRHDRLARLYLSTPDGFTSGDSLGYTVLSPPALPSGGGGLVSTIADYHRFTQFLLRRGEFEGVRLLGPRTVDYMTRNHLPGQADLVTFGRPIFAETPLNGVGFGLGLAVLEDPVKYRTLASAGEYNWGGLASTAFWTDPAEAITVILMAQLAPSNALPLRTRLRQTVYQALID